MFRTATVATGARRVADQEEIEVAITIVVEERSLGE